MNIKELYEGNEVITLASYLEKNDITDIEEFLNPTGKYLDDCLLYNNMREGVQLIKYEYLMEDSIIVIIQDGDGDGVCSTVPLYSYLTRLKPNWDIRILIHESKQRGLDDEKIMDSIREIKPSLVIVPDAGTNNNAQAEILCDMGIGLLILDHHDFDEGLVKLGTLISNQDPSNSNTQRDGSGALVVHKFLQALDIEFNKHWSQDYIDLVALSLVSDSRAMNSMENRTYYYYGLETINCIKNEFLYNLIITFIGDKPYTQRDISFKIVPKINAICRHNNMEYKERLILAFLGMDNIDEVLEICKNAHEEQTKIVSSIIENNLEEIESKKKNNLIIFASDDIPRAYSGLVCAKVQNICDNKPSIVGSIKDGYFIGSLRSPIPLRQALNDDELVDFAQGHADSCGVGIYENNINALVEEYNNLELSYEPQIKVLKSYSVSNINNRIFKVFNNYGELWGKGLSRPVFEIHNIAVNPSKDIKIMGKDKRTLKITKNNVSFMIFSSTKKDKEDLGLGYYEGDKFVENPKDEIIYLQIVGSPSINVYKNKQTNQFIVDKYEISCYNKKTKNDLW